MLETDELFDGDQAPNYWMILSLITSIEICNMWPCFVIYYCFYRLSFQTHIL